MKEILKIASENPKKDQWKTLAQYAFPKNITRYFEKKGYITSNEVTEFIAGCFRQSEAYFNAAEQSTLDISPLLQYYGAATLLAGTSALVKGQRLPISGHGMKLNETNLKRVADVKLMPVGNGALQQFNDVFSKSKLINGEAWTMEEILGSIPDLKQNFESCYQSACGYTIPVELVKRKKDTIERILLVDLERHINPIEAFTKVEGFNDSYLKPEKLEKYIVLHKVLKGNEIGIYSLFGQKHLPQYHEKKGKLTTPSQIIVMYMGMFVLGYLSRYFPEIWNPFVRNDETGELLLIERFISLCQRMFPNLVLNEISELRVIFVNESQGILDISSL
jgi:hypothetical protein